MKNMTARVGEKVSRPNLWDANIAALGTYEALDLLQLGVNGKWAMWRALAVVALVDIRLQGIDFDQLTDRAARALGS